MSAPDLADPYAVNETLKAKDREITRLRTAMREAKHLIIAGDDMGAIDVLQTALTRAGDGKGTE